MLPVFYHVFSNMEKFLISLLACATVFVGWYQYQMLEKLNALQNANDQVALRTETLEENLMKRQAVAVHVRLSGHIPLVGTARVMYDVEITNIGNAYNFQKGEFTATVSGTYMISVTACLGPGGQWMDLNIIENDKVIGRVFSGDDAYHSCGSEALSIRLDEGDTVWVQRFAGSASTLNQEHGWNSFTAILIKAD